MANNQAATTRWDHPTGPTPLRRFADVVERLGPNVLRRALNEAADTIEMLRSDRDLLVQVLREYTAGQGDDAIAFGFDAPGARLHTQLKRILAETPSGSSPACSGEPCICTNGIGCVNVPVSEW